jgi:hypothetical protein
MLSLFLTVTKRFFTTMDSTQYRVVEYVLLVQVALDLHFSLIHSPEPSNYGSLEMVMASADEEQFSPFTFRNRRSKLNGKNWVTQQLQRMGTKVAFLVSIAKSSHKLGFLTFTVHLVSTLLNSTLIDAIVFELIKNVLEGSSYTLTLYYNVVIACFVQMLIEILNSKYADSNIKFEQMCSALIDNLLKKMQKSKEERDDSLKSDANRFGQLYRNLIEALLESVRIAYCGYYLWKLLGVHIFLVLAAIVVLAVAKYFIGKKLKKLQKDKKIQLVELFECKSEQNFQSLSKIWNNYIDALKRICYFQITTKILLLCGSFVVSSKTECS